MFPVTLLLLSAFIENTSCLTVSGTGMKWSEFNNRLVSTNILDVIESVSNVTECLRHCLHEVTCVSVFYRTTQRQCQLHDVLFLSEEDGVEDTGTEYFSLTVGSCPVGYVHVRKLNLCYRHVLEKKAYSDIAENCGSRDEHLIVIDSQEKHDHVQKQILASSDAIKYNYYIDGKYSQSTGQWKTHNGHDMTFFSWGEGLPLEHTFNSPGMIVLRVKSQPFYWSDDIKLPDKYFMCEKDI